MLNLDYFEFAAAVKWCCLLLIQASVGAQILDMVQNARCMVHSHPYFPDTISIALWVAALNNDSQALGKLQSHGLQPSPRDGGH